VIVDAVRLNAHRKIANSVLRKFIIADFGSESRTC
jgi:hypothetical protein